MSEPKLKVTDKRMFTSDGELREEFRHLEESAAAPGKDPADVEPAASAVEPPAPRASPASEFPPEVPTEGLSEDPKDVEPKGVESSPPSAQAEPGPEPQAPVSDPRFMELVAMLAEPVALYMGDATMPDGRSMEDSKMARLHIDLLETLEAKTRGNLEAKESDLLENVLYQVRVRFMQKFGPS